MRWFIEVSSGNPTGHAERWVVEAPQWQPALQAARTLRGEPADTTGFSIELLEDGFRVVDPATLVRYVVRRAPDGTPVSTPPASKPSAAATDGDAATQATNGGAAQSSEVTASAQPNSAPNVATEQSAAAPRTAGQTKPPVVAPVAEMSGMTQAERIAAMLSVDPTPRSSSRAPRAPSAGPKSGGSKAAPRSVPAARNGGQTSRAPASDAPPKPSGAVLRAPQGAALRAPRAAAVAVPAPPRPISNPPPATLPEPRPAETSVIETVLTAQAIPAAPEPSPAASQPPPRMVTQAPAAPTGEAPVVQSLSQLQALVRPSVPPRPVSQPPPAPVAAPPAVDATATQPPPAPAAVAPPAGDATAPPPPAAQSSQAPVDTAAVSTAKPFSSAPPEALPLAELLFQRSEDPSSSSPLTYREAAWAVPEGTSIAAAVRLLAGMFEGVRAALAGVKPGKLVYMAIFDHRFVGKPTRPPLATLTWKDWKDQGQGPEIRRQGEPRTSFQPPPRTSSSFIPAAVPQPSSAPPQAGAPQAQAPLASVPPAAVPVAPPPVVAPAAPAIPPVIAAAEGQPVLPAAPVLLAPPVSAPVAPVAPPYAAAPATALVGQDVPQPPAVEAHVASVPVAAGPPAAIAPALVPEPAAPPAAPKLVIVPEPEPAPSQGPAPAVPAPPAVASPAAVASPPAVRLSGVELIADLFECMHDLHFLPDALAGADFVLRLMLDKLPSAVALVHFYDIDAREFVVVRAVGAGAAKVMQLRTNEKEPLIAEAMRKRRAVVIDDATTDPRAQNGRWALIGDPPRSLVCAPVEEGGRFLGLLELTNPLDGQPFHEGDGHAITYIGEQFAEFLADRGIVLDPERIGD